MTPALPARADVVIIGGGVIGCSIAYHLAALGITDVLLLERKQLTSGTTWHAAGLIGQLRASRNMTELAKYTTELLRKLEAETGQETGFRQNGSISLATNAERFEELRRGASMAKNFGLEVNVVGPAELRALHPLVKLDDIVGGVHLPADGQANPIDVTMAYAKGARARGARLVEGVTVEDILVENGRAVGVRTREGGEIRAGTVVVAAGLWSRALGARIGVSLPLQAAEHFYVVTEPVPDLPRNLPVTRVPDECAYYKEDAGKILLGWFEQKAKPWGLDGIPEDSAFLTLPEDWGQFEPIMAMALERLPVLGRVGIQTFFNGPESFTPDDKYLVGETAECRDLFVACGMNSIGIQSSGGVGKVMAEWIRDRHAPMDLIGVDVRRLHSFQSNRAFLAERTTETLGLLYAMHWPHRQFDTARGVRRSPFHDRLVAAGAVMGESNGWERPNWFAPPGSKPEYVYSWGRQNWFSACAAECRATRDAVALYDQSSFAKFLVTGRDAVTVLNRVCAADVNVPVGRIVYTPWLNARGGFESDLTVTRTAETEFLVVTSGGSQVRDLAWLKRHMPEDARCAVVDVTSGLPMLGLMGPRSRALLASLTRDDLSNEAFPFGRSREIDLGFARVRASRITYVGELGWELVIPAEFAQHVFDRLVAAGGAHGLVFAGMHAMNSCRMEKGYRHWGHDIGDEDDPVTAGLGFTLAWDKPGGFIGREALLPRRGVKAHPKRLVQVKLDDATKLLHHEEPIWRDGRIVGSISSGAHGHRLDASLGMGWVRHPDGVTAEWLAGGFEVEIAWERVAATAQLSPWYDPRGARIRA